MIHHFLTQNEIENLNQLHIVKKCNTCLNFSKINRKCKIHKSIVNSDSIQCDYNQNYKYHFNPDYTFNKILIDFGVNK